VNPLSALSRKFGRLGYGALARNSPEDGVRIADVPKGGTYLRVDGTFYRRETAGTHRRRKYIWELSKPGDEPFDGNEIVFLMGQDEERQEAAEPQVP
jgi:hypothetical protein